MIEKMINCGKRLLKSVDNGLNDISPPTLVFVVCGSLASIICTIAYPCVKAEQQQAIERERCNNARYMTNVSVLPPERRHLQRLMQTVCTNKAAERYVEPPETPHLFRVAVTPPTSPRQGKKPAQVSLVYAPSGIFSEVPADKRIFTFDIPRGKTPHACVSLDKFSFTD